MTNVFYIRVSSATQKTDRQNDELQTYCETNQIVMDTRKIYTDYASGKDFKRPSYTAMKKGLNKGDTLFITALDRLGRNKDQVLQEWYEITKELEVDIVVTSMPLLDTRTHKDTLGTFVSDLVLQVLTFVAEDERTRIRQRQKEGIAAAKKRGKQLGRPKKGYDTFTKEEQEQFVTAYNEWKSGNQTAVSTFKKLNMPKATFYRIVKQYEVLENIK